MLDIKERRLVGCFHPDYYVCGITTYHCTIIHTRNLLQEKYHSAKINTAAYFTANDQFKTKSVRLPVVSSRLSLRLYSYIAQD